MEDKMAAGALGRARNYGWDDSFHCLTVDRAYLVSRSQEPSVDGVIASYDEHEDSVYSVEWSSADPWVFASLSYDGRLVINRVPRTEKYKILL